MTTEQHRFPRKLLHPPCDDDPEGTRSPGSPHHHPDEDCATLDEQMAWNLIVNRAGLNADMLTDTAHVEDEFVWDFERPPPPSDEELFSAKVSIEDSIASLTQQLVVIDRVLAASPDPIPEPDPEEEVNP